MTMTVSQEVETWQRKMAWRQRFRSPVFVRLAGFFLTLYHPSSSLNFIFVVQVPLLQDLKDVERLTIADALKPKKFSKGTRIITQGERGNDFYILKKGVCSCTVNNNDSEIEVLRVEPGGYFGEIALLTNQPRKANVVAVEDCECLVLDRATFKRVMGPLEKILERNMENYKAVLEKMGL